MGEGVGGKPGRTCAYWNCCICCCCWGVICCIMACCCCCCACIIICCCWGVICCIMACCCCCACIIIICCWGVNCCCPGICPGIAPPGIWLPAPACGCSGDDDAGVPPSGAPGDTRLLGSCQGQAGVR